MSAYDYMGFYPAHYDTPDGSRYVNPGESVDWPDGAPDHWWKPVETAVALAAAWAEPEPASVTAAPETEE